MENALMKPNILYITTHDQGIAAACFANYGPGASNKMHTPNIDTLASQGAMLTQHFGTAPQCSPARGSLITGQYPHVNGLVGLTHRGFEITNPSLTIQHHFKNHGYKTRLIGFQHEIEGDPQKIGYDVVLPKSNYTKCHELIPDIESSLKEFKQLNEQGSPFWLSIGAKEVHLRWGVRSKRKDWPKPKDVDVPAYLPDNRMVRKHIRKLYGDLSSYDQFLGKIWKMLDDLDLRKNTIIIVTTDHGIAHPRAKGTLYDPGNHDLMIWASPDIPKGKKIHSLLSSVDFSTTLCDMCGIEPSAGFMGNSYKEALLSNDLEITSKYRDYVFTELSYHDIYNPMRAIRSDKFKFIINFEPDIKLIDAIPGDIRAAASFIEWKILGNNTERLPEELYDLQKDPLEEVNLLKNYPDHPEYLKMKNLLLEFLKDTNDPILKGPYPLPEGGRMSKVGHNPRKLYTRFRTAINSFNKIVRHES